MKLSNLLLILVVILLVTISHYVAHAAEVEMNNKENATSPNDETFEHLPLTKSGDISPSDSLRGLRLNFQSLQKVGLTCSKYPRVCWTKGSPGPDCCKGKCVNVERDRNNCGMCGNKCKYSEICCNGRCVNPMFNRKNCGGCNNECKKGSLCAYGMCDYA